MEFKGSTGQWSLNCVGKANLVVFSKRRKGYRTVCNITKEFHEDSYNAQLISKSPEMLDMLKAVLATEHLKGTIEESKIKRLIKEATEI